MKPFYVYVHRRANDGQIFYIGQGTVAYRRAHHAGVHRNQYWRRVAAKHGRIVEIWSYWDTQQEACVEEIKLIEFFRSQGVELTNMTAGGEGTVGKKQPERVREILRSCAIARTGAKSQRGLKTKVEFLSGECLEFVTGREAAKYLGVSPCTVSEWIKNKYTPDKSRGIKKVYIGEKA